jgi:hypothetical protein
MCAIMPGWDILLTGLHVSRIYFMVFLKNTLCSVSKTFKDLQGPGDKVNFHEMEALTNWTGPLIAFPVKYLLSLALPPTQCTGSTLCHSGLTPVLSPECYRWMMLTKPAQEPHSPALERTSTLNNLLWQISLTVINLGFPSCKTEIIITHIS